MRLIYLGESSLSQPCSDKVPISSACLCPEQRENLTRVVTLRWSKDQKTASGPLSDKNWSQVVASKLALEFSINTATWDPDHLGSA